MFNNNSIPKISLSSHRKDKQFNTELKTIEIINNYNTGGAQHGK